jgi:hypothetical protein
MIKTPDGKVLLWGPDSQQREHWPIDARGMLRERTKDGQPVYSTEPPEGTEPKLPPMPPRVVGAPKVARAQVFEAPPELAADPKPRRGKAE